MIAEATTTNKVWHDAARQRDVPLRWTPPT